MTHERARGPAQQRCAEPAISFCAWRIRVLVVWAVGAGLSLCCVGAVYACTAGGVRVVLLPSGLRVLAAVVVACAGLWVGVAAVILALRCILGLGRVLAVLGLLVSIGVVSCCWWVARAAVGGLLAVRVVLLLVGWVRALFVSGTHVLSSV